MPDKLLKTVQTNQCIDISDDDFDEKYKPIQNHIEGNAPYNGAMFETYGPELEFIQSYDESKVWTLIDADKDYPEIVSGYCHVNRLGYFITELAVPENTYITVIDDF